MYSKHCRKLAWSNFLGSFPMLLVQQFCGALMNSCLLEYATVLPIKNNFQPVILILILIKFRYYLESILKWNCFFQPLYQSSVSYVTTSTTNWHRKCVLIYKLKDFRYWNFDTTCALLYLGRSSSWWVFYSIFTFKLSFFFSFSTWKWLVS